MYSDLYILRLFRSQMKILSRCDPGTLSNFELSQAKCSQPRESVTH